jgi:small-conductance mechanosensitive channel
MGLDRFAESAVSIRARTTTRPIKQWGVAREFNARLKKAFETKKIEIPFRHLTVYMGEDRTGNAPPLHVACQSEGKSRTDA